MTLDTLLPLQNIKKTYLHMRSLSSSLGAELDAWSALHLMEQHND